MAELEIQKNNDGVKIISAEIKGIITHRDVLTGKIQAYPLDNYSDKLGARHWLARRGHNMSKKSLENLFKKISKGSEK